MKKLGLTMTVAALACAAAQGEIYYSVGEGTTSSLSGAFTVWCDASGTPASVQPKPASGDGNIYVITTGKKLESKNGTFKAKAYLGCIPGVPAGNAETRKAAIPSNAAPYDFDDCTLVNGTWNANSGGTLKMLGNYTVADGCTFLFNGQNCGSEHWTDGSNNARHAEISGKLSGAADTVLQYSFSISTGRSAVGEVLPSRITISGDASAFKGKYSVWAPVPSSSRYPRAHLIMASASAFGDSTVAEAVPDAVKLGNEALLELTDVVVQTDRRGVTLDPGSGKVAGVNAEAGKAWTLTAPLVVQSGSFIKRGAGTVTLAGAYTVGSSGTKTITVDEGTLVLDALGTFPADLVVTVKAGATLVQHKYLPGITVTCEEGGVYEKAIEFAVPYDPATGETTPFDFTSGLPEGDVGLKLTTSLSVFPLDADEGSTVKSLDVAKLPTDGEVTTNAFSDVTEKLYNLPQTWFEIEPRDGYRALVLKARPVVVSTRAFVDADGGLNAPTAAADGFPWSDGKPVGDDRDYLLQHNVQRFGAVGFQGHSISVAKGELTLRWFKPSGGAEEKLSVLDKATVYPGVVVYPNHGSIPNAVLRGDIALMGDFGGGSGVTFQTRWSNGGSRVMRLDLQATLSGVGTSIWTLNYNGGAESPMELEVSGENANYTGCMFVDGYTKNLAEGNEMRLVVGKSANLGGSPAEPTFNALRLSNLALLQPKASMTLDTENRGIYVNGKGGFLTPEGVELTVLEPLRVKGEIYKKGPGTLALGGAVSFGEDGTDTSAAFFVREGAVKALADAAVAGFAYTFSGGTAIALDPQANLQRGLFGSLATVNPTDKIGVTLVPPASADAAMRFAVPICTVPEGSPDLSETFVLQRAKGYTAQLVKETVEVDSSNYDRYSVLYESKGLTVFIK